MTGEYQTEKMLWKRPLPTRRLSQRLSGGSEAINETPHEDCLCPDSQSNRAQTEVTVDSVTASAISLAYII
jgi:hypothetical protein